MALIDATEPKGETNEIAKGVATVELIASLLHPRSITQRPAVTPRGGTYP